MKSKNGRTVTQRRDKSASQQVALLENGMLDVQASLKVAKIKNM